MQCELRRRRKFGKFLSFAVGKIRDRYGRAAFRSWPLAEPDCFFYPEEERTFGSQMEFGTGEWIEVGPEGCRAYLAVLDGGTGDGVIVLHAWWGLTLVLTDVCDRLATEGFVALASDLYANRATTDSIADAEQLVAAHDSEPEVEKTTILAAVDQPRELPAVTGNRIGVIGFSLGVYWALHLAKVLPDDASSVVTVYGTDNVDYSTARAAYLGHFVENDGVEPLDSVRAGDHDQHSGPRSRVSRLTGHRPLVRRT